MERKTLTLADIMNLLDSNKWDLDLNKVTFVVDTGLDKAIKLKLDQVELHKVISPSLKYVGTVNEAYEIHLSTDSSNYIRECYGSDEEEDDFEEEKSKSDNYIITPDQC